MNSIYKIPTIAFVSILLLTLSCQKHRAKKLAGTYACKVDYHVEHAETEPNGYYIFDTTYFEDVVIVQDGKDLKFLNYSVHIDQVKDGKTASFAPSGSISSSAISFKNDEVYIYTKSGGQGGWGSYTYNGKKKKK
jgi:hypothetical protein